MFTTLLITALFPWFQSPAKVMTVCDVLRALEDVNGSEVTVRGVWSVGDQGQNLFAEAACERPTIRDGWLWADAIQVLPSSNNASSVGDYQRVATGTRPRPRIVATLTGTIETRDRFPVRRAVGGSVRPLGYKYFVAVLRYRKVDDLVAKSTGTPDWEMDWLKHPYARPVGRK